MSQETTHPVTDLIEAWNAHDLDRIVSFYSPEYEGIDVAYAVPRRGWEDIRQTMALYLQAFPDLHVTLESLVVQDNRAALAWIGRGTHQGRLMNIPPTGPAGRLQTARHYLCTAYPDIHMSLDDLIVEGDKVAGRWIARGTNTRPLLGIPPTGRQATVTGISILTIVNGQVTGQWTNWDTLGMLQQLGVVPTPGHGRSHHSQTAARSAADGLSLHSAAGPGQHC